MIPAHCQLETTRNTTAVTFQKYSPRRAKKWKTSYLVILVAAVTKCWHSQVFALWMHLFLLNYRDFIKLGLQQRARKQYFACKQTWPLVRCKMRSWISMHQLQQSIRKTHNKIIAAALYMYMHGNVNLTCCCMNNLLWSWLLCMHVSQGQSAHAYTHYTQCILYMESRQVPCSRLLHYSLWLCTHVHMIFYCSAAVQYVYSIAPPGNAIIMGLWKCSPYVGMTRKQDGGSNQCISVYTAIS